MDLFTQPTTSAVPDVTGLNQATACNRLGQAGFQCGTTTSQASQTVPKGDVISSSPSPGAQAPANANVNLVLSSGPSSVLVPDVMGDTQAQAVTTLQGANLAPVVICQSTVRPIPGRVGPGTEPQRRTIGQPGDDGGHHRGELLRLLEVVDDVDDDGR